MVDRIDLREVSGCTCLAVRRVARLLTQAYDHALEPAALTVNQFGLLAKLHGASQGSRTGVRIGALAERLGMHPTTLNRDLKPLRAQGLVADAVDASDRRARGVVITAKGRARLRKAIPHWRRAQARLEGALGAELAGALGDALDSTSSKLRTQERA
jgi:DNA-binding MarR family transcriptional regulator